MKRLACKSDAEVSCIIANLISELEQPCGCCKGEDIDEEGFSTDGITLKGVSPIGTPAVVRILPGRILEVKGDDELLEVIRERRCHHER